MRLTRFFLASVCVCVGGGGGGGGGMCHCVCVCVHSCVCKIIYRLTLQSNTKPLLCTNTCNLSLCYYYPGIPGGLAAVIERVSERSSSSPNTSSMFRFFGTELAVKFVDISLAVFN